jgi:hypothetical protein
MSDAGEAYADRVTEILIAHRVTEARIEQVRLVLAAWFARKPPETPQYLVPQMAAAPDGGVITAARMVEELEAFTPLGRSYVELFIAGGITNPHLSLDDALARLESER